MSTAPLPDIWTDEQVAVLEARQRNMAMHPYTCGGDRTDEAHRRAVEILGDTPGTLVPTRQGWLCPVCGYRQFWSHETQDRDAARDSAEGAG